jgi:hypothetical protein
MKSVVAVCFPLVFLLIGSSRAANPAPPAQVFDLHQWKLQIPGPKEFKDLKSYSSDYFHLDEKKEMVFDLDAAEKGTTPNTHYVRSELRHMLDWKIDETHGLSGEMRVESHLNPDKVTVLQIHGITDAGDNAPPFLRIAINKGDLYAVVKTENSGDKTQSVLLKKGLKTDYVKVAISIKAGTLAISVNDQEKLHRDVAYWKFSNYFKAGCYPQATEGKVKVVFRKLSVY